jgi:hypothetical protein
VNEHWSPHQARECYYAKNKCRPLQSAKTGIARGLASDEVRARIIAKGGEPDPTMPQQHAATIEREEKKWSAGIFETGIQAR